MNFIVDVVGYFQFDSGIVDPPNVKAVARSGGAEIVWEYPFMSVTPLLGYRLFIDNAATYIDLSDGINSYRVNGLQNGTSHRFAVQTRSSGANPNPLVFTDPITPNAQIDGLLDTALAAQRAYDRAQIVGVGQSIVDGGTGAAAYQGWLLSKAAEVEWLRNQQKATGEEYATYDQTTTFRPGASVAISATGATIQATTVSKFVVIDVPTGTYGPDEIAALPLATRRDTSS